MPMLRLELSWRLFLNWLAEQILGFLVKIKVSV
jgi:hypothetical protein